MIKAFKKLRRAGRILFCRIFGHYWVETEDIAKAARQWCILKKVCINCGSLYYKGSRIPYVRHDGE